MTTAAPSLTDKPADQPANDAGAGSDQPANKPAKPDGFPEALNGFWSDDAGFDYGKAATDFTALTALKVEHDARVAQVPENIDEYEIALPADFKLPDGPAFANLGFEALKDHPMAAAAREFAKSAGLTRDQFKGLIAMEANRQIGERKQLADAVDAERGKLGTKGQQRVDAVVGWAETMLGKDLAGALMPMMYTARQIEAFEKIMSIAKAAGPEIKLVRDPDPNPNDQQGKPIIDRLAGAMYPKKAS